MASLSAYLNRHFPTPNYIQDQDQTEPVNNSNATQNLPCLSNVSSNNSIGWTNKHLLSHFMDQYGVSVRIVDCYYLFKYYVILQGKRWGNAVLSDCRGTIIKRDPIIGWKVVCRPFEKFFNQQEKHCCVHSPAEFNRIVSELQLVEKADGTMILVWWRECPSLGDDNGYWQVSTQTVIEAEDPWPRLLRKFLNLKNRIITAYPDERLYLLASIHNESGDHMSLEELDRLAALLKVHSPKRFSTQQLGLYDLNAVLEWVESKATDESLGKDPEGFVAFYKNKPLCKLKNRAYYDKHNFFSNNLLNQRNLVIEKFFQKTLDDIQYLCSPPILEFIDELQRKVKNKMQQVLSYLDMLLNPQSVSEAKATSTAELLTYYNSNVKNFLDVLHHVDDNMCRNFFIKYKTAVFKSEADISSMFMEWIERNWPIYRSYWKETTVPEIVQQIEASKKNSGARNNNL